MLRHDDGLSNGVGEITDGDWTLLDHGDELAKGLVMLADHLVVSAFAELTKSLDGWLLVTNALLLSSFLGLSWC